VHGSWQVVGVEFAVFADIDEDKLLAAVEPGLDRVDAGFADALLGIVDDFSKSAADADVPWRESLRVRILAGLRNRSQVSGL